MYRFIYYKVQNREEAEDITQETYVKAISYLQKNNNKIDKHLAFLKTVSLNVLRDKWRKKKRQGGVNLDIDGINPEVTAIDDQTDTLCDRELIEHALQLLKEEQRMVITLRILQGYSIADTAKIMNRKENNISVLQYRALQQLATILKKEN